MCANNITDENFTTFDARVSGKSDRAQRTHTMGNVETDENDLRAL
jgi:hypothetical protein